MKRKKPSNHPSGRGWHGNPQGHRMASHGLKSTLQNIHPVQKSSNLLSIENSDFEPEKDRTQETYETTERYLTEDGDAYEIEFEAESGTITGEDGSYPHHRGFLVELEVEKNDEEIYEKEFLWLGDDLNVLANELLFIQEDFQDELGLNHKDASRYTFGGK